MSDLTKDEQEHVRGALHFLHAKCGTWKLVAHLLRFKHTTLAHVGSGEKSVSASLAVRIAHAAGIGVDDVLAGKFPAPGTCPRCGHRETSNGGARALDGISPITSGSSDA